MIYPKLILNWIVSLFKATFLLGLTCFISKTASAQELVFRNPALISGTGGANNAVYRFSSVTSGVDALVKINGRSNNLVSLVAIDLSSSGFDKAFQPQVTYNNNTTPNGVSDWWMEFQISFVKTNTSTPVTVNAFKATAVDIDGNGDKINEWVGFYGFDTYATEANTTLIGTNILETVANLLSVTGRRFDGPVTNYTNIDTGATRVMVTTAYSNTNSFRVRTGGHSTGASGAADRMNSIYFKNFNFVTPTEVRLPVTLKSFTASLDALKPALNWVSSMEENLNYYSLERSTNGVDFNQVSITFAKGNSVGDVAYKYTDNAVPSDSKGVLYYRLKMVDIDGKFKYSETKLVRMGSDSKQVTVQLFPNPVVNDLRIGLPAEMQQKAGSIEILTLSGQVVKQILISSASQTEQVSVSNLPSGAYLVRVNLKGAVASQRFIKQ